MGKRKFESTEPLRRSASFFLLILSISIFLGEIAVHLFTDWIALPGQNIVTLIDAALLLAIIFPFLYLNVFRPLNNQISKLNKAEKGLSDTLSLLEAIIESIHNGILVVDEHGAIIQTNNRFSEMWSIPKNILSTGDDKLLLNYVLDKLSDPEEFISKVLELYGDKQAESIDEINLKDGRIFKRISKPLCINSKSNGRVWSFLDITERKKAVEDLKQGEERYRQIFENAQEGIFQTHLDGSYISVNPAFAKMLGFESPEELISSRKNLAKDAYSDPNERDHFIRMMAEKGFVKNYEYEVKHRDGHRIWFLEDARAIKDGNGEIQYFEGFVVDISERKRSEEEIKHMNEELLKLNSSKDKFLSIISHDLRSPFNGFLGLTKILAEELPSFSPEELQNMLSTMEKSATTLFRLLENLLNWARSQQGMIPFNPSLVPLRPIVDDSIATLLYRAQIKEIKFVRIVPENFTVFTDSNMLQTIILNLVSNALKFTPRGGNVTLSAKLVVDDFVEIAIKDTGIGMNQTLVDQLFRIDVQTRREGTEQEPSTGLGLLLCKEFVEKHGGKIVVMSEEGNGSNLSFTIPAIDGSKERIICI